MGDRDTVREETAATKSSHPTPETAPTTGPYQASLAQRFGGFSGDMTARKPDVQVAPHALGTRQIPVDVVTLDGDLPGELVMGDMSFWVRVQQLELAPREDLLHSLYDPNDDPDFDRLKAAVDQFGEQVDPLTVLPAHRNITINGESLPMYLVYDRPELYYALVAVGRARVRVRIPSKQDPGEILFTDMARKGQLRRDPSVVEIALAARRLYQDYGYTLQVIAGILGRDAEGNAPSSVQYVHYLIQVAGLTPLVRQLLHQRHIGFSQARAIAGFCGSDPILSEQLASLAAQRGPGGRGMTFLEFQQVINRLKAGLARLEVNDQGVVEVVPMGTAPSVVPPAAAKSGNTTIFYQRLIAAPPALVRQAAKSFRVAHMPLIPADRPEKVAVPPQGLDDLREWLSDRRAPTTVQDLEATLLGFLEAIRMAGAQQGLITSDGALSRMIDATPSKGTRQSYLG